MAESLSEKRKEKCGQRPRKKKARKEKEAEGLRKENVLKAQSANVCQRHKSEKKNDEKHKVLEKKSDM